MADHGTPGTAVERHEEPTMPVGTAVVLPDSEQIQNPGFPPYRPRVSDLDPKKARSNERRIALLFAASMVGSVFAIVAYIVFPINANDPGSIRLNNLFLGLGIALSLLGIGIAAVHWSKALMEGHDLSEERHTTRGSEATRARAVEVFHLGNKESGFTRRKLVRNTLIASLALWPLPGIIIFRDLGPANQDANDVLRHTMWKAGTRLTKDPNGVPIKASDVTLGSVFHVIPEGLEDREDALEQKAKAAVLLMRLKPEDLHVSKGRENWNYHGIVAYSKICTHVGCPVALYEQQTHHLLCPCHQSQFDITHEAEVIFGPAKRPLPQLPITVDSEGYLVARSDFHEPVGPSFWERDHT
jgi:ubiquinol-cytochrome c reductase iron-sulfur subunit